MVVISLAASWKHAALPHWVRWGGAWTTTLPRMAGLRASLAGVVRRGSVPGGPKEGDFDVNGFTVADCLEELCVIMRKPNSHSGKKYLNAYIEELYGLRQKPNPHNGEKYMNAVLQNIYIQTQKAGYVGELWEIRRRPNAHRST